MAAIAVKVLVIEAQWKIVRSSTGVREVRSCTPKKAERRPCSRLVNTIAAPTTSSARTLCWNRRSTAAQATVNSLSDLDAAVFAPAPAAIGSSVKQTQRKRVAVV